MAAVVVVVHKGQEGIVELFAFLKMVEFAVVSRWVRQLVEGKEMKPSNALEAIDGNAEVFNLGDLLDGEVISNAARSIPDKFVDGRKGFGSTNNVVKQVVEGPLQSTRRPNVRRKLLIVSSG